jgi:hypothetical protein
MFGQATGWFLGLTLITVLPLNGQAHCSISAPEAKACVQTSLLIASHCQNESKAAEEWLDVGDSRGVWELIHPDGQVEKSQGSRYTTAPSLIRLAPGEESTIITPVTRWFALTSAGTYHLRLRVGVSHSAPLQTNEISFGITPCDDADVLAACREFLRGNSTQPASTVGLEAIGGFNRAAAVPCMAEALARNSTKFASIFDGLARIQTPEAVSILIHSFDTGDGFVRLGAWEALHRVNTPALSPELRQKIGRVLKEKPVTFVN